MKRTLLILLSLILSSILVLSACGSSNDEEDTSEEEQAVEEDATEAEEPTDEASSDSATETEEEPVTEEPVEEQETNEEAETSEEQEEQTEVVEENEVFRVFEPAPETVVSQEFTVRGEANVNNGTVHYEFEDGHNILDEGTVSVEDDWGEFEFTIQFDKVAFQNGTIILYEESDDGSRQNQLYIPVTVE